MFYYNILKLIKRVGIYLKLKKLYSLIVISSDELNIILRYINIWLVIAGDIIYMF